ncbi:MAG: GNAT family N-acetyltransferase [Candidatus Nanopelagicaceae bacterium]|nr:GNAT family N-acetyltransferase [Candidatus Nanopelagicaceae bacterium]
MDDLQIRAASVSDAKGIAKVHVYTWQSTYLGLIPDSFLQGLNVEKGTANWIKNIESPLPRSKTLVAEMDGEIVGFIGVGADREEELPNHGEVYAIYVLPSIQGRGIGTALMREGLTALKTEGLTRAVLWVLDGNLRTRAWYESHGWRSTGRRKLDQREKFALEEIQYRIEFESNH